MVKGGVNTPPAKWLRSFDGHLCCPPTSGNIRPKPGQSLFHPLFSLVVADQELASPVGDEQVCLGQRVMMLRLARVTDPDFLLRVMNSASFYRRVVSGLGATTSPHLNVGDIQKQLVPRPCHTEQQAIGNSLSRQQRFILSEEVTLDKLKFVKHGLMHDLLTGHVRVKVAESEAA